MTKVLILGAYGRIGQLLVKHLLARGGFQVTGLVRKQQQANALTALGARGLVVDVEKFTNPDPTKPANQSKYADQTEDSAGKNIVDVSDEAAAKFADKAQLSDGIDVVIFVAGGGAGSGVTRKWTVDYGGSVLLAKAAIHAGIGRFIQISAIHVDDPVDSSLDPVWTNYLQAKKEADSFLQTQSSKLDWTIIRPGILTDDASTGKVALAKYFPDIDKIPREDVALVIIESLLLPETIHKQFELISGDTPIIQALKEYAKSSS